MCKNDMEAALRSLVMKYSAFTECELSVKLDSAPEEWNQAIQALGCRQAYALMAHFLSSAYEEQFGKAFLFSESCMAFELAYHINAYFSAIGYSGYFRHITTFLFTKDQLISHCRSVEISTQDVHNFKQALMFRYRRGIRECYRHTVENPYLKHK